MIGADRDEHDSRLLFLAATSKDAATTRAMLSALGIRVEVCPKFDDLLRELKVGAGALLLAEEAALHPHTAALHEALAAQPQWSDLPVLLLTRPGADSAVSAEAVRMLGNVTLLERPLRVSTLVSAVRTALRARERQYQIREHLDQRGRAEESLRLADQRKDEFLATLGHELRNPLAPLLTGLQLLKTAAGGDLSTLRVTTVMERQIQHLVRLVNDLLEVSRITRGLIEVHREPLDLGLVVRSAIDTVRPALGAAGHHLITEFPGRPITVFGDAVRLTQVFANLLTNAAKYTNPGGHIQVRVHHAHDQVTVSVRDDGIGIPPEQLASVFEMFTQVDRSDRMAQGGLGIGLTLVRSLITMHGGTVEARSDGLGRGSEFIVQLPVMRGQVTHPAEPAPVARFPRRRILIVDDNHDAADTLGELLAALGAVVSVVHNGGAALEALDVFEPDAVLLDIGMPEMDGHAVARAIRSRSDQRHVLLIALTGWGQEEDRRRSRAAGFDHHIVKPPDIHALRELLTQGAG